MFFPRAIEAAERSNEPTVFSPSEWRTVEAITGRIIPTDHGPGAIEAACVNFIDKALAHEDAELRPIYSHGVRGIDAVSGKAFGKTFVQLEPEQQDRILTGLEDGTSEGWPAGGATPAEFFATVRLHTVWAFLADPKYGGNRDYAGWKTLGYAGSRHQRGGYTADQMLGRTPIEAAWGEILPGTLKGPRA